MSRVAALRTNLPAPGPVVPRPLWQRLREHPEIALGISLFIICVGGWEIIVRLLKIPPIILPAPSSIAVSLWTTLLTPRFYGDLGLTFYEIMAGFALGAVAGLALGGLIGRFALIEKTLYPYIVAFQTVPKVAVAPIVVVWFGFDSASKVVITAMVAFFPILANTVAGLRATPPDQVEMMIAFMGTPWQIFWKARVPQALPYIVVGVDIALMMSVIGAIIGEFVGANAGLGYLILQRNFSLDMAGVFAILVVLSLIGVALHLIVTLLYRRLVFWAADHHAPQSES
jgi:NitT/TauT family transport system permease protein